jgi:hypothetical protein
VLPDSGSNVHAILTRLVSDLELQVNRSLSLEVIKFGDGTRGPSTYSCHLGSLLGTVIFIPGLVNSTINVQNLNEDRDAVVFWC